MARAGVLPFLRHAHLREGEKDPTAQPEPEHV